MNAIAKYALSIRSSLNKPSKTKFIDVETMGDVVPKVVHQTYSTKKLPIEIKNNIAKMKSENPDWIFKLYDDNDINLFITKNYPQLLSFYKKINPKYGAAKADFFRYLVMYKQGGVYLDIKSGLNRPLNEITADIDHYVLSNWPRSYPIIMQGLHNGISNPMGEYQQWHIISVKGHPYLEQVINNVCNNITHYNPFIHDFGSWGVFNLTGPIAYSEAIYPILNQYPHSYFKDHLEIGLEYCAINKINKLAGHHAIFKGIHYSKLTDSVVLKSMPTNLLFKLLRPSISLLKKMLKNVSKS
ncbi:MAG TPA: glycosyltransferase [Methylophilus sp.]